MPRSAGTSEDPAASGVLLCDKRAGVTSHDEVARVRRERGGKAGHAGTLDPFATGLLIVLLGRATRLQRYLLPLPKTYRAVARLGWRSSTGDPDGELTETGVVPTELSLPQGKVSQRVPLTSAVKVGGERLYKRAHRGEVIETPVRGVEVYRAELVGESAGKAEFEIECSAGTYVRTLIETLGDAYCEELRRVAVGPFRVEDVRAEPLPVEEALAFLPERRLDRTEVSRVGNGVPIAAGEADGALLPRSGNKAPQAPIDASVRLTHAGELVAIGRVAGDRIHPEVVLRPASQ